MTLPVGLILDVLLAVLLVATLAYCLILSRKLDHLRNGQSELHLIIDQLGDATLNAERAIRGLKLTADETDARLSEKLSRARILIDELTALARAGSRLPGVTGVDPRTAKRPPQSLRKAG